MQETDSKKYRFALLLSYITIGYNLCEGLLSTVFGAADETLALFGFGVDSFVEVISGIGVAHMIGRIRKYGELPRDRFEIAALRITGTAFYILVAGLLLGSALTLYLDIKPETTRVGIIISLVSILTMYVLYKQKLNIGKELDSAPIISDAHCTKTCFYLSFILLASSLIYEFFKVPFVDTVGSLGIAWYAYKEGREAFEKAKSKTLSCSDSCC